MGGKGHDMWENKKMLKLAGVQHDENRRRRLRMKISKEWLRLKGDVVHCGCKEFN
jgi:hypothetical protein